MRFLKDRTLIALFGSPLVIIVLFAISFIVAIPGEGHCISPSPVISVSPNPAFYGQNITVSGQGFTPNKKAFLYQIDVYNGNTSWSKESGYTTDVDKNGNASWVIMEQVPYPGMIPNTTTIYAQDVSIVGNRSNTITLTLLVNPCITPFPVLPLANPSIPLSPIISANPVINVVIGSNITVSGQHFTPNGIAVLYSTGKPENYTVNVDKNGNITLYITQTMLSPYQIYAIDGNLTSRKSNTITIYPSDAPTPSPASTIDNTVIILLATSIILLITEGSKKKV